MWSFADLVLRYSLTSGGDLWGTWLMLAALSTIVSRRTLAEPWRTLSASP